MKKLVLIFPLMLLVGCTNKLEENKYEYLSYKSDLQKQVTFDEEDDLEFNTYFNLNRVDEERIVYSITIDDPKIDMYDVKALLIHDFITEDVFPSVGIFDDTTTLFTGRDDKIILKGTIQTEKEITDTKFKLYLEYKDKDGLENNIYYEVSRG